jgi:hypothetical protein
MQRISDLSLKEQLEERYTIQAWRAYHEDWIFATRVDCRVVDPEGRPLLLSWEVRHDTPPRDWLPKRDLFITPLTRSAAELAPSLLPVGVQPQDLPLSKFGAGFVYDVAHDRQGGNEQPQ